MLVDAKTKFSVESPGRKITTKSPRESPKNNVILVEDLRIVLQSIFGMNNALGNTV